MRVLVLVLSCRKPPYDALYEKQRATWDSVDVEDVSTRYYWGDDFASLPGKLKEALDSAVEDLSWDLIFRTNSSSYVDKKLLFEFAGGLPLEKCYAGVDGYRRSDVDGSSLVHVGNRFMNLPWFASGCGFFVSRDCVEILREWLVTEADRMAEIVSIGGEDVVVGKLLKKSGIRGIVGKRFDYWQGWSKKEVEIQSAYHVRCRHWEARDMDLVAMADAHRIKGR